MALLCSAADGVGSKVNGWRLGGGHSVEHRDMTMDTNEEMVTNEPGMMKGVGEKRLLVMCSQAEQVVTGQSSVSQAEQLVARL